MGVREGGSRPQSQNPNPAPTSRIERSQSAQRKLLKLKRLRRKHLRRHPKRRQSPVTPKPNQPIRARPRKVLRPLLRPKPSRPQRRKPPKSEVGRKILLKSDTRKHKVMWLM